MRYAVSSRAPRALCVGVFPVRSPAGARFGRPAIVSRGKRGDKGDRLGALYFLRLSREMAFSLTHDVVSTAPARAHAEIKLTQNLSLTGLGEKNVNLNKGLNVNIGCDIKSARAL